MRRTQIYLEQDLHHKIYTEAKQQGISISELIRRILKSSLNNDNPSAKEFFLQMQPLESFSKTEPQSYVKEIRSKSHLLK